MLIFWTKQAADQLAAAHKYVAEDNQTAADQQITVVMRAVDQLAGFPQMGRPGRVNGTRELVISGTPLVIAYRLRDTSIRILAVLHGARRWPRRF
jgi:toxin ParE1/3/4